MLSISYTIAPSDLDAFIEYSLRRSRKERFRVLIPFVGIPTLGTLAFFYWQLESWAMSLILSALVAIAILVPSVRSVKLTENSIRQNNSKVITWAPGSYKLTLDERTIQISCVDEEAKIIWQNIDQLVVTATHAFLLFPRSHAWIIPLTGISEDERSMLLRELTTRISKIPADISP